MNPQQTTSLIGTIVAVLLGPGSYLVARGLLTADQASQLEPAIVTIVTLVGGVLVAWMQHRSNSAPNLVSTINSTSVPGVKVVRDDVSAPPVAVTSSGAVVPVAPARGSKP